MWTGFVSGGESRAINFVQTARPLGQTGASPFQGGKDHLSHRLIRSGLSRKVTAVLLWSLSAIFSAIAIIISFDLFTNEFVGLSIGITFWIFLLGFFLSRKDT